MIEEFGSKNTTLINAEKKGQNSKQETYQLGILLELIQLHHHRDILPKLIPSCVSCTYYCKVALYNSYVHKNIVYKAQLPHDLVYICTIRIFRYCFQEYCFSTSVYRIKSYEYSHFFLLLLCVTEAKCFFLVFVDID